MKMGEAVNACVDSLAVLQCPAIYWSQGLATAWRVGALNYETVLLAAREELEEKLKKSCNANLFFLRFGHLAILKSREKQSPPLSGPFLFWRYISGQR